MSVSLWISMPVIRYCLSSMVTNLVRNPVSFLFECGHGIFTSHGDTGTARVVELCSSGPLGSVSFNFSPQVCGLELSQICPRNRLQIEDP